MNSAWHKNTRVCVEVSREGVDVLEGKLRRFAQTPALLGAKTLKDLADATVVVRRQRAVPAAAMVAGGAVGATVGVAAGLAVASVVGAPVMVCVLIGGAICGTYYVGGVRLVAFRSA